MKQLIIICCCLTFMMIGQTEAQNKTVNKFYRKYKFKKGVRNVALPHWLIKLGTNIGSKHANDEEGREALKMAGKKVRKMKLLYGEEGNPVKEKDRKKLLEGLKGREAYDDLLYIREGAMRLNIFVKMEGDMIKNMLVFMEETDEFMMLSLKTKINMKDFKVLFDEVEEQIEYDIPIEDPELEPEPEPLET